MTEVPTMLLKISNRLNNTPLSRKILYILLPGIFLLAFSIAAAFALIIHTNNNMLYETSADLLSYSARDISSHLTSAATMSDFILADSTIQSALSETKDADSATPPDAYGDIHSALNTYYQRFQDNYIDNIKIVTDDYSVNSYGMDSHIMPSEMEDELIEKAREHQGGIYWITDYRETYGIFLVRSIRRIEYMKLDEIGILIVNINLKQMMEDISAFSGTGNSTSYVLSDGNQILYAPDIFKNLNMQDLNKFPQSSYAITDINGGQYFTVPGVIRATDWNYYSLTPYSDMYHNLLVFESLFIIVLLISLFLCIILTRALIGPIRRDFEVLMTKIKAFGNEKFEILKVPYSYKDRRDEIGLLNQQFDTMALKIQSLIRENYETQLAAKDSQLRALEMQINPHFLYNTLQSINWHAKLLGSREISMMTEAIGKLLRITLSRKNEDSSLAQELELVHHYITIQEIRYEGSISYETDVPDTLMAIHLPKFILQPLVENAIHYSIESNGEDCLIRIEAGQVDDYIVITVANTGSEFEPGLLDKLLSGEITPHGFGIGILNVYQRLELTFGSEFRMELTNDDGFAIAKIYIPRNTRRKNNDPSADRR